jgi:hypothetical protein
MAVALWLVAGVVAEGGHVEDEHVVVVFAMVGEGLLYEMGRGCGVTHDHALAVMDVLDGLCGLRYLSSIVFFPVHC